MHNHISTLLRQGERGLAFQIEMLLTTHIDCTLETIWSHLQSGVYIALGPDARSVLEPAVRCQSVLDCQDRGVFLDLNSPQTRRLSCRQVALCDDEKNRLANIMHRALGQ